MADALSYNKGEFCGRYHEYPNLTNSRKLEAGLRLQGIKKVAKINEPLVSVITVVYNNEANIERAINSVLCQTYGNIEYIIIDGCSTDNTLDRLKKYLNNIDYIISEPDKGIYEAMNKGIELAKGDYIALLNSDDRYTENAIESSINKIIETKADYSGGDAILVDDYGNSIYQYGVSYFDTRALFSLNPCSHISMVVSRKVYNQVGYYDTQYRIASDLKFQLKVAQCGFKAVAVDNVICIMETNGISCKEQDLSMREVEQILKDFHPDLTDSEISSITNLKYRDQLTSSSLDLLLKVLNNERYNHEQKNYLADRINNCFKKTMYIFSCLNNQTTNPITNEENLEKISLKKLFKIKVSKFLYPTIFFKPLRATYKVLLRIKNVLHKR